MTPTRLFECARDVFRKLKGMMSHKEWNPNAPTSAKLALVAKELLSWDEYDESLATHGVTALLGEFTANAMNAAEVQDMAVGLEVGDEFADGQKDTSLIKVMAVDTTVKTKTMITYGYYWNDGYRHRQTVSLKQFQRLFPTRIEKG